MKTFLHQLTPMTDGVNLSTDIYLPDKGERFPFILIRTPYSNNSEKKIYLAKIITEKGFGIALQDVRGRYDSEGDWEPFINEESDGLETQKWLANQPYCDGNIGLMGRSYEGYCVWIQLPNHHPAVKTAIPVVPLPDPVINVPYQDGELCIPMLIWAFFVHGRTNQDFSIIDFKKTLFELPINNLDKRCGIDSKMWQEWIQHPTNDDYWKQLSYINRINQVDIPLLHVCGWYDDDGISTYKCFPEMRKNAKTQFARDNQHLLIGPWPHAINTKCEIPGVDFGEEEIIEFNNDCLNWFERWLKNKPNEFDTKARARIFLMGENKWHDWSDWHHPNTQITPYYLKSNGKANTLHGDGCLTTNSLPNEMPSDSYQYDPSNPTPYIFDALTLQIGGPTDQRDIEQRDDVLVFTSEPVEDSLTICGRIFTELYVSTTAVDTDFTGKLCIVLEDGTARQLCDGMKRLTFRNSLDTYEPVTPGEIYKVKIDMWATGITLNKGQRLRLEIASCAMPKFARNLNTGNLSSDSSEYVVAEQTIYHNAYYPSCLLLPIITKKDASD